MTLTRRRTLCSAFCVQLDGSCNSLFLGVRVPLCSFWQQGQARETFKIQARQLAHRLQQDTATLNDHNFTGEKLFLCCPLHGELLQRSRARYYLVDELGTFSTADFSCSTRLLATLLLRE